MENKYKVTILIVDDNPANIFVLEKLLDKEDRIFMTASNGNDALKIALDKDKEVDLIILDVQMPEMDGFEVAQILRSNKRTNEIPIIFASAVEKEHQSIIKGFEEGAVDYLFKPLDPEITKAKVAVLLKIQRQKRELLEKNISLEKAEMQIRKLNSDLQQNLIQLEASNKELESFSYSVSHDLRAPLRILSNYSSILAEDYKNQLDEKAQKFLTGIQRNSIKMTSLIDALLKFSQLGKKDVQKTEVNMDRLVQTILVDIRASAAPHTNILVGPLLPAQADQSLLTQVWINLISNGLKYSAKKENPVIEIRSEKKKDEVVYYVRDNGVGFEMQYVNKLFGVFQRLHADAEFEGTGVGLAIVQRIIAKHGGRVWAEGKIDEGAAFYFSLPDKKDL